MSWALPREALLRGFTVTSEETLGPCEKEHLLGTRQTAPGRCAVRWDKAGVLLGLSVPGLLGSRRAVSLAIRGGRAQASVTSMLCSWLSRVASFAFFLLPSCCFFCFLDGSWSIGAGFTNGISSWSPGREESAK